MRSRDLLTCFAIGTAIWAGSVPAPAPASVLYTMKTVERWDPQCPAHTDAFHCPHITFKYPVIEGPPYPAAAAINRAVNDFLLTSVGEPRRYQSLDAAIDAFMGWAREGQKLPGERAAYWEERLVKVRYQSARIISLNFDLSFFTGGLHPQYASLFACFNAMTGAKLRLADVLIPDYEPRLTQIAEKKFRASNGIDRGTSLREAGYTFFKNDTFALNDNFWIGPRGLTFFYNPYEIAPWSMGTTEVFLPYREIRDLIKPDGLLGAMR